MAEATGSGMVVVAGSSNTDAATGGSVGAVAGSLEASVKAAEIDGAGAGTGTVADVGGVWNISVSVGDITSGESTSGAAGASTLVSKLELSGGTNACEKRNGFAAAELGVNC